MPASPAVRPPSTYHEFRGDIGVQDIFVAAIEKLRRRGQNFRILYPGTDRYELERMDVYNYSSICHPCLIIQPKRTAEVSAIVKGYTRGVKDTLAEIKATGANLGIPRLCVCGGRNSMNAIMEGSIVLDLSRMNGVDVDADARTVTVQGGTRIYELDDELAKHGLMAVTGTVGRLGVCGTVLGGGYGYASRKFGLACDNIVSAELIIADGRLKRCSPTKNEDLYWSLCGGGGGIGVVTQLTLRCFPIQNAGLLAYDLSSPGPRMRKKIVAKWADWICGGNDTDAIGAPNEVYSHIVLRTDWKLVSFLGTSIDTEVVPQSADHLEYFHDILKRKSLVRELSRLSGSTNSQDELPVSWDRTPGLSVLQKGTGKFGSPMRLRSKFRMVPYCDGIQSLGDALFSPGNVYNAYKYASAMTEKIVDILAKATMGDAPNNESRIVISSAGGAINDISSSNAAFDSRDISFVIYIEGRWSDTRNNEKDELERKKIVRWVHAVASQLQFCEGIKSTSHPESTRDYVSKSDKSEPPAGWYNFEEDNGTRLDKIKKRRDPRNVFSLASRVSWQKKKRSSSPTVEMYQGAAKAKTERVEAMRSVRHDKSHDDSDGEDDASLETTDVRFEERSNDNVHEEDDSDEGEVERRDGRSRRQINHQASSRSFGQESYMTDGIEEGDEDGDWADFDDHGVDEQRQVSTNRDDATERSLTPSPASTCVGREVVEV
mmetsp:Transcript_18061/g.51703  ORF Transcript_18061/g.51703 Transcript_18061/m.51703 type:complete len:716 (+) Transcript_18061:64-2211(+)